MVNEREQIAAWLRELAQTASNEQARGAYAYAAEGVERGEFVAIRRDKAIVYLTKQLS